MGKPGFLTRSEKLRLSFKSKTNPKIRVWYIEYLSDQLKGNQSFQASPTYIVVMRLEPTTYASIGFPVVKQQPYTYA